MCERIVLGWLSAGQPYGLRNASDAREHMLGFARWLQSAASSLCLKRERVVVSEAGIEEILRKSYEDLF